MWNSQNHLCLHSSFEFSRYNYNKSTRTLWYWKKEILSLGDIIEIIQPQLAILFRVIRLYYNIDSLYLADWGTELMGPSNILNKLKVPI